MRKKGSNSWQVRVSLGERDPETGRYRYVVRQVHGTKRDAQRAADALAAEVARGSHRHSERRTVSALLDQWMVHLEGQGRALSTLVRYHSAIRANIKPALGNIDIAKLEPAQIDYFYSKLLTSGLTPLTVRKSHAILAASFAQALRWGWVDRNPVLRASPPSTRGREIHPPTPTELGQLLEACSEHHPELASLVYTAATTGARRGELCGLRWGDVDLDTSTLTIARSISDAGQMVSVKGTKTHQARRLALDPGTVEVLLDQRRRANAKAEAAGTALSASSYVWSQAVDGSEPYRPDRVTGSFRSLRDRLGLRHVTFHALRHFSATTLAGQGVGVRTIAGRLGHANPGITLRTYAHFLDVADREAAALLGDALSSLYPASARRSSAASKARRGTTTRRPRRTDGIVPQATRS